MIFGAFDFSAMALPDLAVDPAPSSTPDFAFPLAALVFYPELTGIELILSFDLSILNL